MKFLISLKTILVLIANFLTISMLSTVFVYAQNSPLAMKGDQAAFGNLKVVSQYGHVVFADQPNRATVGMLKDQGIKMVINVRGISENEGFDERKAVEEQGITYLQIPYMDGREISADAVEEIIDLVNMTGESGTKIMLHCTHSQRTGSLLGVALVKAGYSREEANRIAKDAGMTSEFITRIHNDFIDGLN